VLSLDFGGSFAVDQAVALDDMQSLAVGSAEGINCRERRDLYAHCVDHQCIALVPPDRVALPARRRILGMRRVQAHMAHRVVEEVKQRNLVSARHNVPPEMKRHYKGRGLGPATIVQVRRHVVSVADKRTRSKWSRMMRYAAAYKPDSEPLEGTSKN
jgi:hypothetical protein